MKIIDFYSSSPLNRRLSALLSPMHVGQYEGSNYLKFIELGLSARLKDDSFRSIVDLEKAMARKAPNNEIQKALVKLNKQNSIIDLHSISG